VTDTPKRRWEERVTAGLSWFVAIELFLFAPLKFYPGGLFGYPSYATKFVRWGYPGWFAMVIGGTEILAGVLLIKPKRRFLGALILVLVLTGAVTTLVINHDAVQDSVSAPIHLAFAAVIALANWPVRWTDPLRLTG
jgi:uncharacterized membrane protein YphA (DoxX/SURF4 family)